MLVGGTPLNNLSAREPWSSSQLRMLAFDSVVGFVNDPDRGRGPQRKGRE
jgi:hypothetical protein